MTKPMCPNCKNIDYGATLPSDHGGQFFFTRCGNCNHGYMYNVDGEVQNGHREQVPSKEKSMQRYRLTYISPLGDTYDADPMESADGKWYSAEEADLYVARLKWEHESIEQMQRDIKQKLDARVAELESQVATLERSNKRLREKLDRGSR